MTRSTLDAVDCRILADALGLYLARDLPPEDHARAVQMRAVFDLLGAVDPAPASPARTPGPA